MTKAEEDRFLHTFRRSSYAAPLREIVRGRLEKAREEALTEPVSPRTIGAVDGAKTLMTILFGETDGNA